MAIKFSRLKLFRTQEGYTQEEVAEKLGVTRQSVAKWERGEAQPDIESCVALANLYGTTVDALIREMGQEKSLEEGRHIFGVVRMNDKGQITLPAACRKLFRLESGDAILVLGDEAKAGIALVNLKDFETGEERSE